MSECKCEDTGQVGSSKRLVSQRLVGAIVSFKGKCGPIPVARLKQRE